MAVARHRSWLSTAARLASVAATFADRLSKLCFAAEIAGWSDDKVVGREVIGRFIATTVRDALAISAEADVLPASAMPARTIVPKTDLNRIHSFDLAVSGLAGSRLDGVSPGPFPRLRGRDPPGNAATGDPTHDQTGLTVLRQLTESTFADQFIGETLCICDIQLHDP